MIRKTRFSARSYNAYGRRRKARRGADRRISQWLLLFPDRRRNQRRLAQRRIPHAKIILTM